VIGGIGEIVVKGATSLVAKDGASEINGAVPGSYVREKAGKIVEDYLNKRDKKNDLYQIIIVIFMCLILFLEFDAVSILFTSIIFILNLKAFHSLGWILSPRSSILVTLVWDFSYQSLVERFITKNKWEK